MPNTFALIVPTWPGALPSTCVLILLLWPFSPFLVSWTPPSETTTPTSIHSSRRPLSTPRPRLPTITRRPIITTTSSRAALESMAIDSLRLDRIRPSANNTVTTIYPSREPFDTRAAVVCACSFIECEAVVRFESVAGCECCGIRPGSSDGRQGDSGGE